MAATSAVSQMIEIKNYDSKQEKVVWDDSGKRDSLGPLERRRLPYAQARVFMDTHPRYIREYEPVQLPQAGPGEKIAYVANVTGSRFHHKEITTTEMRNNTPVDVTVENPLCKPVVRSFRLQGSQTITGSDDDRKSYKAPAFTVDLEPLRRYPLPEGVASTILQRDSRAPAHRAGGIVRVDPPTDFEPNETWPLNDLRLYAAMIDPEYFTEARLDGSFPDEATFKGDKGGIDEAGLNRTRRLLMDAIFPCLVSDQFGKPTREAFTAIKNRMAKK